MTNGIYLRNRIQDIKTKLACGYIDYNQAKKEAEPFIAEMNRLGEEVAKRFGKKFSKFTFVSLMR